jgi:hypothetical protein
MEPDWLGCYAVRPYCVSPTRSTMLPTIELETWDRFKLATTEPSPLYLNITGEVMSSAGMSIATWRKCLFSMMR